MDKSERRLKKSRKEKERQTILLYLSRCITQTCLVQAPPNIDSGGFSQSPHRVPAACGSDHQCDAPMTLLFLVQRIGIVEGEIRFERPGPCERDVVWIMEGALTTTWRNVHESKDILRCFFHAETLNSVSFCQRLVFCIRVLDKRLAKCHIV